MPPKIVGPVSEGNIRASLGIGSLFKDDLHLVNVAQTKVNKTTWPVFRADISPRDQASMNEDEIFAAMLALISEEDMDCLDMKGTTLFRVTKRVKDIAGKNSKKAENRNVAMPIRRDEIFTIGEEYYFVLVRNSGKSASSSVVGGSETSAAYVIRVAVGGIIDIETQKMRLTGKTSSAFISSAI